MTANSGAPANRREREHGARVRLFQILCALDGAAGTWLSQAEIESRFSDLFVDENGESESDSEAVDRVSFDEFRAVCAAAADFLAARAEIDGMIERHATGWKVARMALVDRTAIRLALYEAFVASSVTLGVALSEAVLLAKEFGGTESGRFVNGVLARVVRAVRA